MSPETSRNIQKTVRRFISDTPNLSQWVQGLDPDDVVHELQLLEVSLESGQIIVPPLPLVGLVQKARLRRRWKETVKLLNPWLPDGMGPSEAELCAIGLVWCELLMEACRNGKAGAAFLPENGEA